MDGQYQLLSFPIINIIHTFKGGGEGGYGFFLKKNILIPNVTEKNILILVEEKKKYDSEFLSNNLMSYSGKKIALSATKKNKYSNSCVVRKKISERNKKP